MTGTLVIAQVRNANHDDEKFIIKAVDNNEAGEAECVRMGKEIEKSNKKYRETFSECDECYISTDYTKKPCKVVYAIVHNELSNYGAGFGVYGLADSKEKAVEMYKKHIKWHDEHWKFDEKPQCKLLDAEDNGGVLFKDIADSDVCSMEFACVRLIPNGNPVEVNF